MAYRIYEVDGLTDIKTLVEGDPYPDSDMALTDRRWLIKAQEDDWMCNGKEITKFYQIVEV